MSNDLDQSVTTEAPEAAPRGTILGRVVRGVLLVLCLAVAVFILYGQISTLLPVGWLAAIEPFQVPVSFIRDTFGSWNIVFMIVILVVGWFVLRGRGRLAVSGLSVIGLVLVLITTTVQIVAVHDATGQWYAFSPATPTDATGRGPDKTVTYATLGGQEMKADIYTPKTSGPAPLVVFVHGGGFVAGSRGPLPYQSWLADNGFAVFDVDYRLATATDHTWNTEDADVGCALTWATLHALEYHWDLTRVASYGGSAGGNLAVNIAYKVNAGTLTPSCGLAPMMPKFKAVIASYPAVDLTDTTGETPFGVQAGQWYLGGAPAEHPDRYAAVDSARQITPAAPPTLLIQGGADHLVFASHTKAFADQLTAAGITNRYVELPYLDHGYDLLTLNIGTEATRALMLPWYQKYLG
ncbi:alpha/beta hydrolase fold domain-containing protein [Kutzneria sp. NPDC052558]|uniref:alpha/beta hydrolase fold domain-containing protein n=1 Tax=Kutzneria sp. NPDC052558 TaxID=3364121 RepID=UPI0037C509A1